MSLEISREIILKTRSDDFHYERNRAVDKDRRPDSFNIDPLKLSDQAIAELHQIAEQEGAKSIMRVVSAVASSRCGEILRVPSFPAFEAMFKARLEHSVHRGWIFEKEGDGRMYPWLITRIETVRQDVYGSRKKEEYVQMQGYAVSTITKRGVTSLAPAGKTWTFSPGEVAGRTIENILENEGLAIESDDLLQEHDAMISRYRDDLSDGFARQFRLTGKAFMMGNQRFHAEKNIQFTRAKVIHDLPAGDIPDAESSMDTPLLGGDRSIVPVHPLVRVFDLKKHDFYWVHGDLLEPYQYDSSLEGKLVLPETHRNLLDVLTQDIDAFTQDVIDGKAAGNMILCEGPPGVGKTLTAEVYSEIMEKPLYSIHSGDLGITAKEVESNLDIIFSRARRWGCALLLDEADVYVARRGGSLEQNAVVAAFLRVTEYFDGLLFVTTNRIDDIDDAFVSRCIAVIRFDVPSREDAIRIWGIMADQFGCRGQLSDETITELVDMLPNASARDIKLLLRQVLRVSIKYNAPLDKALFRKYAPFRGSVFAEGIVE